MRNLKWFLKSLLFGILLASSIRSFASHPRFFDKLDINRDGFISMSEHRETTKKIFEHIDKNKDGVMTSKEIANNSVGRYMIESDSMKNLGDFDKDNRITIKEYATMRHQQFMMADMDQDQQISKNEMDVFYKYSIFSKMDYDKNTCITPEEFIEFDFKYSH